MKELTAFLKRKDIEISAKRYGIDALAAMAQGLFCSLLIGTIINTVGAQFHLSFLTSPVATIAGTEYTVGGLASAMSGPAMATAIGWALHCPPLVLFSLITVGFASNALGGAGGPLAVLFVAVLAAECGKAVAKETKVDILLTPLVTIAVGLLFSALRETRSLRPPAAICSQMVGFAVISYPENGFGGLVSQGIGTSMLQMGNIVRNPKVWIAPCVTSMITGPIATCVFHLQQNGAAVASGMGTCGLVGPLGVYTGWVKDVAAGQRGAIGGGDWAALLLISVILPAILCPLIHMAVRRMGLVKDGDLKLA